MLSAVCRALALMFLVLPLSAAAAPCAGFSDVEDTDPFCPNVTWIKNRNVTLGCGGGLYCPATAVSRLAMAAFLHRLGNVVLPPNVIWVAPVGGQFQSIQAAIDHVAGLSPPAGLVKVAPGAYLEAISIPDDIVVEGSGRFATEIRAAPCGAASPVVGAVTLNGIGAQLRNASVHVHLNPVGSQQCAGIVINGPRGPALSDVDLRIQGTPPNLAYGLRVVPAPSTLPLILEGVRISTALPSGNIVGMWLAGTPSTELIELRNIEVSGLGQNVVGIAVDDARVTLDDVRVLVAASPLVPAQLDALLVAGSAVDVVVRNSLLRVGAGGRYANNTGFGSLRIATSLLEGVSDGTMSCFGNYDASMAPVIC